MHDTWRLTSASTADRYCGGMYINGLREAGTGATRGGSDSDDHGDEEVDDGNEAREADEVGDNDVAGPIA